MSNDKLLKDSNLYILFLQNEHVNVVHVYPPNTFSINLQYGVFFN